MTRKTQSLADIVKGIQKEKVVEKAVVEEAGAYRRATPEQRRLPKFVYRCSCNGVEHGPNPGPAPEMTLQYEFYVPPELACARCGALVKPRRVPRTAEEMELTRSHGIPKKAAT